MRSSSREPGRFTEEVPRVLWAEAAARAIRAEEERRWVRWAESHHLERQGHPPPEPRTWRRWTRRQARGESPVCTCVRFRSRGASHKNRRFFKKESVHTLPKSNTSAFPITAWPRWFRPKGEEVSENRKRPACQEPVRHQKLVAEPGPPRALTLHDRQGAVTLLFEAHLGAGCWVGPTRRCARGLLFFFF